MGHTVQISILDVDSLGGLVVGRAVQVMGRSHEHFQHPFGEARLEHHAAAPHAHVLTAGVQVVNAHRDCRAEGLGLRLRESRSRRGGDRWMVREEAGTGCKCSLRLQAEGLGLRSWESQSRGGGERWLVREEVGLGKGGATG